jgi:4-diphosphocytidyl-2-C-methyl-D-erythritol kinase
VSDHPRRARLVAQAKINLFLHVLGRREDGYHDIETLFVLLDLGDLVEIDVSKPGRSLECSGPAMPAGGLGPPKQNLAWRAAESYAARAGWPRGFDIRVEKRIPVGGGMGGGSADAGAVLRALDALNPSPLGPPALLELGAELGSDVPFLTSGSPLSLAWGRGERMAQLPPLRSRRVELVVSPTPIATADAYQWLDEAGGRRRRTIPRVLDLAELSDWPTVRKLAANDFESVVLPRLPSIAEARRSLEGRGAELALLSGSGATVFGIFPESRGDERGTDGGDAAAPATLRTRTAERVRPVELVTDGG